MEQEIVPACADRRDRHAAGRFAGDGQARPAAVGVGVEAAALRRFHGVLDELVFKRRAERTDIVKGFRLCGRRNAPALIFGLMNVMALCLFLLVPGVHFWVDALSMVLFGTAIGVLLCFLGGLMAVDIAPRNASGAALGIVGIASYIGAGIQDIMSGILIGGHKSIVDGKEIYDFSYINIFWIGAALLSVFFALLVWNVKSKD